jgi:hypothetical protein
MGTASPYGGSAPRNPLMPSWLTDPPPAPAGEPDAAPDGDAPEGYPDAPAAGPARPAPGIPAPAVTGTIADFGGARGNITRFARSGGHDRRALGRAISSYVRGAGGGASATRRMGSSRSAGAGLAGFLADAANRGIPEALRTLNLPALAGQPAAEIFGALIDVFCPEGGTIDEAIARDAFVEMIVDLAELGIVAITDLAPERMPEVFECFAAHAIEARLENDIALNAVSMPPNTAAAQRVQDVLREFVRRAVHDIMGRAEDLRTLTQQRISGWVDLVYAQAFELLRVYAEAESQ